MSPTSPDRFLKERWFPKEVFYTNQMCFRWLRCSCQSAETSSSIYQKIVMELPWTMEMARNMQGGQTEDSNLSLVGETHRHREQQSPPWKTRAVKRKAEADGLTDEKQPSPQKHRTPLSGSEGPAPCVLACFCISLCGKETIVFNFLINVRPCWQTLWMGHFFLPIMCLTLDLITVEMNQETWLRALHFKCQQSTTVHSLLPVPSHLYDAWCENNFQKEVTHLDPLSSLGRSPVSGSLERFYLDGDLVLFYAYSKPLIDKDTRSSRMTYEKTRAC